ncbi:MAG: methionyl-tRNA formyltransferase [Burkholderiales bacterium PBB1]|nr:MAG: methionyl-tRNA formyltransferase [Burkholderiales bacterium PBB1]
MRLAFAGTPEFARVALAALHAAGFNIPLVLTQPDRPAGRGQQLQPSAVKTWSVAHGLPVIQPQGLRLDGRYAVDAQLAHEALQAVQPDVMVVAAYGLILPEWVLALPRLGCLNIHASLLPRWRGAAPIHRAIEAGDARTGITVMQMDTGLDTGAMLLAEPMDIADNDTTGSLHDRLAVLGGRLIVEALELAACGGLIATAQPTEGVTYARKVDKAEAAVDWTRDADIIARRIRAFNPAPGAVARLRGEAIKLWQAQAVSAGGSEATAGTVIGASGDGITVACGSAAVRLSELQRPGGKRLNAAQFLQGQALQVGDRFDLGAA